MYSSYSFSASALDGGEWSASRPDSALRLWKGSPIPIVQEAGWASKLSRHRGLLLPLPGIERRSSVRPVRSQALYWLSYPGSKLQERLFYFVICLRRDTSYVGNYAVRYISILKYSNYCACYSLFNDAFSVEQTI
jgi:hypothetical protein